MRKYIYVTMLLLGGITINACSEEMFADKFPNPANTTTATIERVMTGVFEKTNQYTMPWYTRFFSFENQQIARYAQTLGWVNATKMYSPADGPNNDRWLRFYEMVAQYRLLQSMYNALDDSEKKEYKVFLLAANIVVYDNLQQVIDLWGDVPFKEAGMLGITMDLKSSLASYDKAEDLYVMMLDDLENINTEFKDMQLSAYIQNLMIAQDYINHGDITLWRRYCNSLCLRIASRAADNGSITTKCRETVNKMLTNPVLYPIIENNDQNILIKNQPDNLEAINNQAPTGILDGFESWNGALNRASWAMISYLNGDPRLDVIYDVNSGGNYEGVNPLMEESAQRALFDRDKTLGGNFFSAVDSTTYSRNNFFPGVFITAAEMDFIKAEAISRWGLSGDAQAVFVSGVRKSVDFYYYLNSINKDRKPTPPPTAATVIAFANGLWTGDANKDKLIGIQKWLHYGCTLSVQAWSEFRKSGYPELKFLEDKNTSDAKTPPYRLRYTANEKDYNRANYLKVQDKDGLYVKIFWAK